MGFFSWKTADTKESILNIYSGAKAKTAYLLQPNGKEAISEPAYNGYGDFGSVDAYQWLAEMNLSKEAISKCQDEDRDLGMTLHDGSYLKTKEGACYAYSNSEAFLATELCNENEILSFHNYASEIELDGVVSSVNDHIESGKFTEIYFGKFIKYPLKFSFDEKADYNKLSASESCPTQGLGD